MDLTTLAEGSELELNDDRITSRKELMKHFCCYLSSDIDDIGLDC